MGAFEFFPYSNFHDLNLDAWLAEMKRISANADNIENIVREEIEELLDDGTIELMVEDAVAKYAPTTKLYTRLLRNGTEVDYTLQSLAQYDDDTLVAGYANVGLTVDTTVGSGILKAFNAKTGTVKATYGPVTWGHNGSVAIYNGVIYWHSYDTTYRNVIHPVAWNGSAFSPLASINLVYYWGVPKWICGDGDGLYMVFEDSGTYRLYDLNLDGTLGDYRTFIMTGVFSTAQRQGVSVKGDRLYWVNGPQAVDVFAINESTVDYVRTFNLQDDPSGIWDMGELEMLAPSISENGGFYAGAQFYLPVGKGNSSAKSDNFYRNVTISYCNALKSVVGVGTVNRVQMRDITTLGLYVYDDGNDVPLRDGTIDAPFKYIAEAVYFANTVGCRVCNIRVQGTHNELAVEVNDLGPNVRIIEGGAVVRDGVTIAPAGSITCGQIEIIGRALLVGGTYQYIQVNERGEAFLDDVTIGDAGYTTTEIPLDNYNGARDPDIAMPCMVVTGGVVACRNLHYTGTAAEAVRVKSGGVLTGSVDDNLPPKIRTYYGGRATIDLDARNTNILGSTPLSGANSAVTINELPAKGTLRFIIHMDVGGTVKEFEVDRALVMDSTNVTLTNRQRFSLSAGSVWSGSFYRITFSVMVNHSSGSLGITLYDTTLETITGSTITVNTSPSATDFNISAITIV